MLFKTCLLSLLSLSTLSVYAASQASSLLKSAQQLKNGKYYIQNVATGQRLTGNKNNLYPAYGKGTAVSVVQHTSTARHTVMGIGDQGDRKCISAQWDYSSGSDGAGAMYSCALGILAQGNGHSNLRGDKQAFILVPAGNNFKRGLTTEASADLEERSIFADDDDEFSAGKRLVKRARKQTAYGPFYMIATDHIQDQAPRAIVNQVVTSLGQRVMKLVKWQKGSKAQMWEFIPA